MTDLDLRLVRYFIAVAESGGFTAASGSLHMSQPALSQAIRRLESVLGATLLDRGAAGSRSGVVLTAEGEDFLPAARAALAAADHALRAVRARGRPVRLVVGFSSDTPRSLTRRTLEAGRGDGTVEVVLQHVPWGVAREALRADELDLAFLQAPPGLREPDLRLSPLDSVQRMAVFPVGHPLARRQRVGLAELTAEPIIDAATDRSYWLVDPRPDGSAPHVVGPPARTVDEMLGLVSAGRGMAITSSTIAATNRSDELVFVPIDDLDDGVVYLAARQDDGRAVVAGLFAALGGSGH